jgi:hypothetical protein
MTVSALVTRNDITATSGQATFTYTFMVLDATDMTVYQNGALLASGYTVTGVGSTTGGTVVLDVGALTGQIVSLVLAMPLDRTTNYQNSGDFLAGDVNGDFDKIYIGAIQNENEGGRSLRLQDVEPPTAGVDMTIPLKADRLGKFLAFDSVTGGPIAGSGAAFFDSAAWSVYDFTGDGTTVAFTLGSDPATENNTQVYIDGVYQEKDGYSVTGAVLTFSVAPLNLSTIEVMVVAILPIGSTLDQPTRADLVSYTPAGTGAVATTVQAKLRDTRSVKDFGAVGNGATDDTAAIQAAITATPSGGTLIFESKNYIISSQLVISQPITLQGSAQYVGALLCVACSGIKIESVSYVQIRNLEIAAAVRHSVTPNTYIGIEVEGSSLLRPTGHIYRDVFVDGFQTGYKSNFLWSSVFDNFRSNKGQIGIRADNLSVNNIITNSFLGGDASVGSRGIWLEGNPTTSEGWFISDNLIDAFEIAIFGNGVTHVYINNNILDHCGVNGVKIIDNGTAFAGNFNVAGNYIAMSGAAGDACVANSNTVSNTQNRGCIVSDNQMLAYSGASCSYGVNMNGTAAVNNIITNNTFKAFATSDIKCNVGPDIITGNQCQSSVTYNINVVGSSIVQNNKGTIVFNEFAQYQTLGQNKVTWSYNIPTTGTWANGDICYKSNSVAGGYIGWACTTAGTPGTWKTFGAISA